MNIDTILADHNRTSIFNGEIMEAAIRRGAQVTKAFTMDDYPVLQVVINPQVQSRPFLFVAGIHGNEVAGPAAALTFIQNSLVPPDKKAVIFPLVNPYGFQNNQRECKTGEDINRLFNDNPDHEVVKSLTEAVMYWSPSFVHSLHEDPDREQFYLYYSDNYRKQTYQLFVDVLVPRYLDVVEDDYEGEHRIVKGLCRPPMPGDDNYNKKEDRTFENHMLEQYKVHHLLTETPLESEIWNRILCHQRAMEYVLSTHRGY